MKKAGKYANILSDRLTNSSDAPHFKKKIFTYVKHVIRDCSLTSYFFKYTWKDKTKGFKSCVRKRYLPNHDGSKCRLLRVPWEKLIWVSFSFIHRNEKTVFPC